MNTEDFSASPSMPPSSEGTLEPSSARLSDDDIVRMVNSQMGTERTVAPESRSTLLAFSATLVAFVYVGILVLNRMPSSPVGSPSLGDRQSPLLTPASAVASEAPVPRWINWTYSLEEGQSRARANHSRVLIDFYTDWCPGCQWVDSHVYTRPDVLVEARNVSMVKINAEGRRDLAERYHITVYPSFIWTDERGNVTARQDGSTPASEFASLMARNR